MRETGRNFQVPTVPSAPTVDDLRKADYLNGHDFVFESLLSVHFSENDASKLYGFQKLGVSWLTSANKRLLADDMGLGKTVQVIFAINQLLKEGKISRAVVVSPHTLILNWLAEFHKWAPTIAVTVLMPGKSSAKNIWTKRLLHSHVIITSYDQLRENFESMAPQCQLLVADEAHRLETLRAVFQLQHVVLIQIFFGCSLGLQLNVMQRILQRFFQPLINHAFQSLTQDLVIHFFVLGQNRSFYVAQKTKS